MNLLYKIRRSNVLECSYFLGRDPNSENLLEAKKKGYRTSAKSIEAIKEEPDCCDIVFDATSAEAHIGHAPILKELNKYVVDLTPSLVGKMCIPCLNSTECLDVSNVNMITCGGQSMVPLAYAITRANKNVKYLETTSTISSISAGPGTRANIDEYISTTSKALQQFTGVKNTKAMIVLNPAEPPIIMRNTLYALMDNPDLEAITEEVNKMEHCLEEYVPGFKVIVPPTLFDKNIVAVTAQVEGVGDFLPAYAGNLDIITCAGIEIAEQYARNIICREEACPF